MSQMMEVTCPCCGLTLQPKNRLIFESCGHKKCKQCFIADTIECSQCLTAKNLAEQKILPIVDVFKHKPPLGPVAVKNPEDVKSESAAAVSSIEEISDIEFSYYSKDINNSLEVITTKISTSPPSISARERKTLKITEIPTNKTSTTTSRKSSQIATAEHIKQHIMDAGEKQYECTVCSKKFKSRTQIYYHIPCGKDGIKKYKCTHCDKAFSSKSHLCYHLTSHKKESHICGQCGKKFSNFLLLTKHKKVHINAGQRCTECGKFYRNSLSLEAHKAQQHNHYKNNNNNHCDMRTVTFKCNLCEKKYFQKSTLRQHMLKHYGKRFECQMCKKLFQRNSTLQRHLKRHGQRTENFVCTECFRNFSDIGSLLRHSKIHKGHMHYKCRRCHITSVRRDNMMRHVRHIHNGEEFQECVDEIKNINEIEIKSDNNATITTILENNKMDEDNYENREEVPKTVANSSVIKFVGNVEPMKIPPITPPLPSPIIEIQDFNDSEAIYINAATVAHKKLKKKYDPIEMYRKILISDDDGDCVNSAKNIKKVETTTNNIDEAALVAPIATDAVTPNERTHTLNTTSNFSATHWRKNFKYTYEYRE